MQIWINMQRSNTQNSCKQKFQCFVLDVSSFSADRDFHIMCKKYLFSMFNSGKSFGRTEKLKNQESRSDVSKTGSLINVSSGEAPFLEVQ